MNVSWVSIVKPLTRSAHELWELWLKMENWWDQKKRGMKNIIRLSVIVVVLTGYIIYQDIRHKNELLDINNRNTVDRNHLQEKINEYAAREFKNLEEENANLTKILEQAIQQEKDLELLKIKRK